MRSVFLFQKQKEKAQQGLKQPPFQDLLPHPSGAALPTPPCLCLWGSALEPRVLQLFPEPDAVLRAEGSHKQQVSEGTGVSSAVCRPGREEAFVGPGGQAQDRGCRCVLCAGQHGRAQCLDLSCIQEQGRPHPPDKTASTGRAALDRRAQEGKAS